MQDKHIKKRVAKVVSVMGVVWAREDLEWRRRIWLFDRLVIWIWGRD